MEAEWEAHLQAQTETIVNEKLAEIQESMQRGLEDARDDRAQIRSEVQDGFARLEQGQDVLRDDVTQLQQGQARLERKTDALQEGQDMLRDDVTQLQQGQARLEHKTDALQEGQAVLRDDVTRLQEGQTRLQEGQVELQEGQARLQEGQARLQEGQVELQEGQARLQEGQKRIIDAVGGEIGEQRERYAQSFFLAGKFRAFWHQALRHRLAPGTTCHLLASSLLWTDRMEAGWDVAKMEIGLTFPDSEQGRALEDRLRSVDMLISCRMSQNGVMTPFLTLVEVSEAVLPAKTAKLRALTAYLRQQGYHVLSALCLYTLPASIQEPNASILHFQVRSKRNELHPEQDGGALLTQCLPIQVPAPDLDA